MRILLLFLLTFNLYAATSIKSGKGIRLYKNDNAFYTELKASANTTATVTYSLPDADGTSGQVLQTSGTGSLSWTDQATAQGFYGLNDTTTASISGEFGAYKIYFPTTATLNSGVFSISTQTASIAGYPIDTVAYWNMDGATSAGEVNQFQNGTYDLSIGAGTVPSTTGKFSTARNTTTANNYLSWSAGGASNTVFDSQELVVGCWIKSGAVTGEPIIMGKTNGDTSAGWLLNLSGGSCYPAIRNVGWSTQSYSVNACDGNWHLVGGHTSRTNNVMDVYYDGAFRNSYTFGGNTSGTGDFKIGSAGGYGSTSTITIDDCLVVSGAKTVAQATAILNSMYNSGSGRLASQAATSPNGTHSRFTLLKNATIGAVVEAIGTNGGEYPIIYKNGARQFSGTPAAASSATVTGSYNVFGVTNDYFEFGVSNLNQSKRSALSVSGK